jgi:hypothetical protein
MFSSATEEPLGPVKYMGIEIDNAVLGKGFDAVKHIIELKKGETSEDIYIASDGPPAPHQAPQELFETMCLDAIFEHVPAQTSAKNLAYLTQVWDYLPNEYRIFFSEYSKQELIRFEQESIAHEAYKAKLDKAS